MFEAREAVAVKPRPRLEDLMDAHERTTSAF